MEILRASFRLAVLVPLDCGCGTDRGTGTFPVSAVRSTAPAPRAAMRRRAFDPFESMRRHIESL